MKNIKQVMGMVKVNKNIENKELLSTIIMLKRSKKPFWLRVAELLERPRRKRVAVNLGKIDKIAKEGKIVVVPGKVLGTGQLTKPVVIAAFSYSKKAKEMIEKANSKALTIKEIFPTLNKFNEAIIVI